MQHHSDNSREPLQQQPRWLGKIVDCPGQEKCIRKEPDQIVEANPNDRVIHSSGVFEIGRSNNGISRIRLITSFFNNKENEDIVAQLLNEIPWQQMSDKFDGVSYLQPRLTAYFGDNNYSYSGITWQPSALSPLLKKLRAKLEETTGVHFNSVLANMYRDQHDNVCWHADDEPELGPQPTIASLSFGEKRRFYLRKKTDESERVCIPLSAGSLLIMDGATQVDWQHCVPQEGDNCGVRINLTYRTIYPPGQQPEQQ